MQLPLDLREAIEASLAGLAPQEVAAAAADLSRRYREGAGGGRAPSVRTANEVAAYAAVRMPATYAAVAGALAQARDAMPGFAPETMLDVGSGPGTALFAAREVFPGLGRATLIERNAAMAALGRRLAGHAATPLPGGARWLQEDLRSAWDATSADLVTAAYVLGELPHAARDALVARLWEKTRGLLVLVEPGTPPGFERILRARDALLQAGAKMAAPCPHAAACPLAGSDWCHFAQRVQRSSLHRHAKSGDLPYEDEKFSFVALSRLVARPAPARVIRRPLARGGHVHLALCSRDGVGRTVVSRRDGALYRAARDLAWGAAFSGPEDGPPTGDPT